MAITEYEDQIQSIINEPDHEEFVYDFLSVYEKIPKATITKLRKGLNNLSKEPGEVYLKNKLYFKRTDLDLMQAYVDVQARVNELGTKPRFIIVTDYKQLLAKDTKTDDTLDIEFSKLPQKFEFFLAWNGIEKADFDKENPADVRAAERFAKLYDVVVKDNPDASRKGLNLFLIRVLFCLFAEDTNIFAGNLFTNRVKQMTQEDGSNFDAFVSQLFGVLDFEKSQRPVDTPSWLNDFPYVDGDLFKDPHESLKFSSKSRKLIIDAGELLNWNQINPDILGSMIQAVASEDSRSHLGMHYTSVPNIMKVIKPLFLDRLREDFEAAKGNEDKLQKLYNRIGNIKFMDPACGSGNFLIITYKELRQLEIDILKELNNLGVATMYVPSVTLNQFYGVEIEDFACDVTRLSLWIAEHQMNVRLHDEISDAVRPTLPLQHAGAILNANSLRVAWKDVIPTTQNDEVYIFGNPPYLGYSLQDDAQKDDMRTTFEGVLGYKRLDYISAWFYDACVYLTDRSSGGFAFVTTNSINQGEQVQNLWPHLLDKLSIAFAYPSFKWSNNAQKNAAVIVSIIGMKPKIGLGSTSPTLFLKDVKIQPENINAYLVAAPDVIIDKSSRSIFGIPAITNGSRPVDDGNLIFSDAEMKEVTANYPESKPFFKRMLGSAEFLRGKLRYALWLKNQHDYEFLKHIPTIKQRIDRVRTYRYSGGASAKSVKDIPWAFFLRKQYNDSVVRFHKKHDNECDKMMCIIIPRVSSISRLYVPMGIVDEDVLVSDSANVIYDAPVWLLGVLQSKAHMEWLSMAGGRLKNDYRYSGDLVYNTFPVPELSTRRRNEIESLVYDILDIREELGGTLADLYGAPLAEKNPKSMNPRLLEAHQKLDEVVDRAYKADGFKDDSQRLSLLLKMYEKKVQSLGE
ncbi:DNA methyltransferase [Lactiplantibacillus plantarum]|uniref:class I SAM-dependent DNA methyltransferase n=1 Tax=Lactiplantibacillus plantarum TaxID=1590 RepID=UPI000D20C4D8|nr:DNA methyltransferase [Lactiplantibacillus plantarum]AVV98375.1 DNA methyltransferase [Lactiplantibacillus plantarum]AVW06924.1 DNA methyltransferase [Lactiplantibacillus plantarum]MCC9313779.1 class I SAM-dependent DNA methyltransferase [Lactiplantibacillus plantarum]MDF3263451.1 class I SAM-dependent DNA methyltransferase [Lactiplantibacillus plantarum]MDO1601904.1 class I SAM-dependent DNA methyltransferase [Lactiplantibacillus plantarum]